MQYNVMVCWMDDCVQASEQAMNDNIKVMFGSKKVR